MAKSGNYPIPFRNGQPMSYTDAWDKPTEWRDNVDFDAIMDYDGFGRGRSSALLYFKDRAGVRYPMFMKDFDECARYMRNGEIRCIWRFVKRGQNYGLTMVRPA